MQCSACGKELPVIGKLPGSPVSCACGAVLMVPARKSASSWSVVSAPTTMPPPLESHGCPRCRSTFEIRGIGGLVVAACPSHHGLFVTNGALRTAREASKTEIEALDESMIPPPPTDEPPLRCPTCGEEMMRKLLGQKRPVKVDTCKTHGTWFDAGELRVAMGEARTGGDGAQASVEQGEDLLDLFNVSVLGRQSLRRR